MPVSLYAERINDVPDDSRVYHYDELEEELKEHFPTLTDNCCDTVDEATAACFRGRTVVKYTDYYEIQVVNAN